MSENYIRVEGARVHNLKNVSVEIPRNKLVVFTGLSGSGKSSLAFDTIYAEGQRRYIDTFSSYARQFLGGIERPDVDAIHGLSPVIAIEQKTVSKNPRSTVGTITEIYDFLRLLYARASIAYSYKTGKPMVKYSEIQIRDLILRDFDNKKIILLAPLVKGRKGHYKELFEQYRKKGFARIRVDGEILDLQETIKLDRYKIHDIELVVDRIAVKDEDKTRIAQSIEQALRLGKGSFLLMEHESDKISHFSRALMCADTGISYSEPEPNLFSFNSPYGACPKCTGIGQVTAVEPDMLIPDKSLSIKKGAIAPMKDIKNIWLTEKISNLLEAREYSINTPLSEVAEDHIDEILYGLPQGLTYKSKKGKEKTVQFEGIVNFIERHYGESTQAKFKRWAQSFMNTTTCSSCGGSRLKEEARYFKFDGKAIHELAQMDISQLAEFFDGIKKRLNDDQLKIASALLREIKSRIQFLLDVGLDYLSLDRPAKSLSGGEAQRIRLATQIGTELTNVLYILDEPSIGLHQRDNQRLINSLKSLRDAKNTVLVVEHDKDMILASDYLVDIGPKAGLHGGKIVMSDTPDKLSSAGTLTAKYLNGQLEIEVPDQRRKSTEKLTIYEPRGNNLKIKQVSFPLGIFTCVTGVSGSGKSTLVNETLYPILNQHIYKSVKNPLPYKKISGLEHVDKIIEIDQSPIGRTPRSNPATYTGVFSDIRSLFANLPEAKIRGYKLGRFSFNVKGGRCETCQGAGLRTIEMNFLPDVYVECETCQGKRYNRETLEVRYKGKSINDVLDMSIETAVPFFENYPKIKRKLDTLNAVGLGYLTLGQASTTLSGGEAQRVKLATELSKKSTGKTVYILDEPSTGLHFEDIKMLLAVLQKLVSTGNTVIVIEHNLDIIKVADHIIDIGPEGGRNGGELIFEGTPEELIKNKKSITGKYLKEELCQTKKK